MPGGVQSEVVSLVPRSSRMGAAGRPRSQRPQQHQQKRWGLAALLMIGAVAVPRSLAFLVRPAAPLAVSTFLIAPSSSPSSSAPRAPRALSTTALYVKREGRRGPGYRGESGGGGGGGSYGGGGGRGRRSRDSAEPSKDPNKRLANLNRKLSSIIELEALPWEELNEEQRQKVERKADVQAEISRLTKLVRQQDYVEEAAEQRKAAASAEDLNQDVVGGRIPRTLLKLLTYCRVSDKATCEVLLELGKVKVNGEVCDNPVALVDLVKDKIEFEGEPVTLPETRLKHKLRSLESQDAFEDGVPKEYCARIDAGLLIDLTRNIEKARGTFVDKSPYIMRDGNNRGGAGRS